MDNQYSSGQNISSVSPKLTICNLNRYYSHISFASTLSCLFLVNMKQDNGSLQYYKLQDDNWSNILFALVQFKTGQWCEMGSLADGQMQAISYFDMHLSLSFSSKDGARVSTVFFLHSTIFVDLLSEPRVTCRLDHRVTVTWSSTCTSLISGLCI